MVTSESRVGLSAKPRRLNGRRSSRGTNDSIRACPIFFAPKEIASGRLSLPGTGRALGDRIVPKANDFRPYGVGKF